LHSDVISGRPGRKKERCEMNCDGTCRLVRVLDNSESEERGENLREKEVPPSAWGSISQKNLKRDQGVVGKCGRERGN